MSGRNILNRPYQNKSIEEIDKCMGECQQRRDEINNQIRELQNKSDKLNKRICQLMLELCNRLGEDIEKNHRIN